MSLETIHPTGTDAGEELERRFMDRARRELDEGTEQALSMVLKETARQLRLLTEMAPEIIEEPTLRV